MPVSIEELCERLGVREVAGSELRDSGGISEEEANQFDGFALSPTRAIAPVVCERLKGASRVLELGCGYGFRLLYYALNNPSTLFDGMDIDLRKLGVLGRRIERLDAKNIRMAYHADFLTIKPEEWKYPCVLAIDCLPEELPTELREPYGKHGLNYKDFLLGSQIHFGRMVNPKDHPSFLASLNYTDWTKQHDETYRKLFLEADLNHLDIMPFAYKKLDEEEKGGVIIFASKVCTDSMVTP